MEIRLWVKVVKDLTSSKELLPTTRTSDFARVIRENDVNVYKQISSLYDF